MNDHGSQRFFVWLDRGFWVIWLGFPLLIWAAVTEVLNAPARLAELAPDQAACLAALPAVVRFSPIGQSAFWTGFAIEAGFYAVVLALAHSMIHRCARGQVLVAEMIWALWLIGMVIAFWPVLDLVLVNLGGAIYVMTGDLPVFQPYVALDLPVLGVGLLMVTMSLAMQQAVALREDADLTI